MYSGRFSILNLGRDIKLPQDDSPEEEQVSDNR